MNEKDAENAPLTLLQEALAKKEYKLQALYGQMGKSMLEIADSGQKAIDALVDEIIEIRQKILAAKQELPCPQCMAYNPQDSRYCRRCGAALPDTTEKENENEPRF